MKAPGAPAEGAVHAACVAGERSDVLAWLRGAVARFSEGDAHRRRPGARRRVIARLGLVAYHETPTRSLLAGLGLPPELETDVALVASAYQPHLPQTVPFTRRVAPSGEEVLVDLHDAPFGRGPHACPGEQLARHLADAAMIGR